jgi:hypothetical protein
MKFVLAATLFVLIPLTSTADIIHIPYATVGNSWWSGLAISNPTDKDVHILVTARTEQGTMKYGDAFTLKPYTMRVDLLEKFFNGALPSSRVQLRVASLGDLAPFQATLFVGNDKGFAFQCFDSKPYPGY